MKDAKFPGDEISEEIEYAAGEGAYSEDGIVRAEQCGWPCADDGSRTISVEPMFSTPVKLKVGQEMYGIVEDVGDTHATITLSYDKSKGVRYDLSNDYSMLRIENAKQKGQYVKYMRDLIRIGDVVKVKILKFVKGAIDVTMNGKGLGVVKAFCTQCRTPMALKNNKLYCQKCDRSETRKIGSPYLEVID